MSGFCWMFVRNDADTAAIMTDPASAVPIDAPRFVIVFWTPPDLGALVVRHGGDRYRAEL